MDNENQQNVNFDLQQYNMNTGLSLLLTLVTCGIYNLYWNYMQMEICNRLLGREEFGFLRWIILSILTCGIYHLIYQYKMGSAITEIQFKNNLHVTKDLPMLSLLAAIFGFSILADCIHQVEINKIIETL